MTIESRHLLVKEALSASVVEFFESYGVSCSAVAMHSAPAGAAELGSMVGFRGKGVRGGLAFVAPVALVAGMLPVPARAAQGDLQLRDWSAEIANQLLGRLKNKLSSRSVDFDVGSPVCFTGTSIRLVFLPDAEGASVLFQVGEDVVRVHLDCSLDLEMLAGDVDALRIAPEGDVLLF